MADESHDCSEIAKVPGSSASTSSSSGGVISNINSGWQGDVVTAVGRDYMKYTIVGGSLIKDVHDGNFNFYDVNPSDVRNQKMSFAKAFNTHDERNDTGVGRDYVKNINVGGHYIKNVYVGGDFILFDVNPSDVRNPKMSFACRFEFTLSTGDFAGFEATTQAMNKVMDVLKDDKFFVIGICGMGGAGKTTLAEHVGAQARNIGLFDQVIMAVVSQIPDLRKIQGTLADLLGLELKQETETGRAGKLMETIMKRNRILIILDDLWKRIELSKVGIPSYDDLQSCNSKVIFTTRRLLVCRSMKSQPSISLRILSEEDDWNFYDVGRQVARQCAGLPIALETVARALANQDMEEWKAAARRLEMSETPNPEEDEDHRGVYESIKLRYDYLRGDDAKPFFLLCCLFPEDNDILIEDLVRYGFGIGLFRDDINTTANARARANSVAKHLKESSLLLEGKEEGCVRMHDVIRDSAISIASSQGFLVKAGCKLSEWPSIIPEGCSAISLMRNRIDELPEELVCSELQILLLQHNTSISEIPETFFKSLNALRVLDLSFTSICLLPPSLSILTSLKALFLDYCNNLIDISRFSNLKKLEILSMRGFPLKELPKEIGDLTNLRMLDLSGSYNIGRFPSKVLSRLKKLEELYMLGSFGDWGNKVEGGLGNKTNAGFDELTGLHYLNTVTLRISDTECLPKDIVFCSNWVYFDICISQESPSRDYSSKPYFSHDFSRTLTLSTTINTLPDWFIKVVAEKAEKLQYLKCKGLKNILVEYYIGRLHGLKYLAVIGPNENLEVLMETITWVPNESVFKNLEELHLLGLSGLKELCVGELPPGSLFNLKSLKVEYCRDLGNTLLPSNLLQRLQNLEKLHCEDMNRMEYVFGSEGLEPEDIILTKVREIILLDLEKLISIWNGPAPNAVFHNLRSLAVSECKKLKSLFTYDVVKCLSHLEDLSVTQCPSLDRVVEPSKDALNKIIFPELKNLALSYLPQLTSFCSTGSATIECPSLEHLHVQDCPHFTTSSSDFHSWQHIQVNDLRHLRMNKDMDNINLAGQHTMDILESLPLNVRKRVEVIREIESQHHELEAEFFKEIAALEAKYQKLYQPLYNKRYLIVNGVVEAEGVAIEAAADHEDKTANERGVPDFWLNALKNNEVLAEEITEHDEGALKYLRDIKWFRRHNSKGFKLEFYFDTNPFFKNSVLTKTYHMIDEDEAKNAAGTEIEWYPEKCLTQKILKKKQKRGSKNSRPLAKTENCKSFFNFFSPPQVPKDDEDIDEEAAEELKNQKKQDYDIGSTICYKIIPHAVSWFTGKAI